MVGCGDGWTVLEVAHRGSQGGLVGAILCSSGAREPPTPTLPRGSMTSQQLLQTARDIMVCGADAQRKVLQTNAIAQGRTQDQVRKASTMRLALWSRGFKSAI